MDEKIIIGEELSEEEFDAEQEALLEMVIEEKIKADALLIVLAKLGDELTITRDEFEMIKNYHFHMKSLIEDEIKLTLAMGKVCSDNTTTH